MRACRLIALFCAVVLLSIMAAPARSATPAFTDELTVLDPGRWAATAHPLGRSALDPRNVAVAGARLALALPAGTTDGAEVRSVPAFRSGTFDARIQAARAPSSISGAASAGTSPGPGSALDRVLDGARVLRAVRHAERAERSGQLVRLAAGALGQLGVERVRQERRNCHLDDLHGTQSARACVVP